MATTTTLPRKTTDPSDRRGADGTEKSHFSSPVMRIAGSSPPKRRSGDRCARAPSRIGGMPLTPPILTRVDPNAPLLWRDECTLQLGYDSALSFDAVAPWVERLLSRLRSPFRRGSFDVIAHAAGAPREEARALLARVEPLLVDEPAAARAAWVESIGISDGRCEYRVRESLVDEGITLVDPAQPPAVAVVLVRGAAAALPFARFLRDDVPHLPVSFEPGRVTVGPLVIPGASACLACRDAQATDLDPAWPLLHAQLIGRDPGPIRAVQVAEAGRIAAVLLGEHPASESRIAQVSADGSIGWHSVRFHEECRCREPWSPSQRGTSTETALPAPPFSPTTATGSSRRA